jgi:primosomal protein N' (replication factor Y) (superfamily II helicase)
LTVYCDVSLPVPLDQAFTYAVPTSLGHRVKAGARVVVPFGTRKLTGVVLALHAQAPGMRARAVEKLIDAEPVFDEDLLRLAQFIANYYCAPLGEVLRTMAPLGGELRKSRIWALTDKGHQVTRQL